MTWSTLFITPLILTFPDELKERLLILEWIVDISWSVEICMNFIVATKEHRDFKSVALNYITGYFIFDVVATIPPMVYLEKNNTVNFLKMIRPVHISEAFKPFHFFVARCMHSRAATENAY